MKYLLVITDNDYKLYPQSFDFLKYQLSLIDKEDNEITVIYQGAKKEFLLNNFFKKAIDVDIIFSQPKEDKFFPKNYMGRFNRYLEDIKKSIFNKPYHNQLFIKKWVNANTCHPFDVCSKDTLNKSIELIEENDYESIIFNNIGLNLIPYNLDDYTRSTNKFVMLLSQLHSLNNKLAYNYSEEVNFWIHNEEDEIESLRYSNSIISPCNLTHTHLKSFPCNLYETPASFYGERFSDMNFNNQQILILTNGNEAELHAIDNFLKRAWKQIVNNKKHLKLLIAGNVENIEVSEDIDGVKLLNFNLDDDFSDEVMNSTILVDPYRSNSYCSFNTVKAMVKNIPIIALEKDSKLFTKYYKSLIRPHDSFIELHEDVIELISNRTKWKSFKSKASKLIKKRFRKKGFGG